MSSTTKAGGQVIGENTSLLRPNDETVDDRSSTTLSGDEEELLDTDKSNQHVGRGRGLLIALSVWALIFLQASNMSGITTTQSKIAEDLNAFDSASWFTSSYLIAMSSFSPLVARLAQIFSPRDCMFVSSFIFAIGGLLTSQAPDLKVFLLGRVISGLAAAGIMTISFILVLELSGKKRRGLIIGLLNTCFTMGVSLGAVIAGALLKGFGWRFLFWVQSPLAILAGFAIFFTIPKSFTSGQKSTAEFSISQKLARIDYLGAFLLTSALILFLFGMSWPKILWLPIVISVPLVIAFIFVEIYVASEPIIPVTVLKSRGALLSCIAQLGIMSARWMVLFYTPTYAIAVLGWSPTSAGTILIPTNVGFATGGILVGWLHIKKSRSYWLASILSFTLFALTLLTLSQISNNSTPPPLYYFVVFLNGLCTGAALNYTLSHLLHLTPPATHFITISLLNTFRGFAGSFGTAIGSGFFVRVLKRTLETGFEKTGGLEGREDLVRRLLGSPALVQNLKGVEKDIAMKGYMAGLKALFLAGVGVAVVMVFVQSGTGWIAPADEKEDERGEREVLIEETIGEEGL
ncbi:hypothetical protein HYALB_00013421 [Hymenoscyphus albidus]|uniref:Major facilitator superfamily (MFS) profile domain-containing protein n=1 Tax=Hymenoscyphus albidus TaxID=595503 RepID=A0A9N9LYG7_9HELO|nr:hypothetical protein HYALB_00013421 [Hymenoscyphus albidus]